jgi:hypothetical protein
MQGLYFVYFNKTLCYIFLMFYIYIFLDLWDVFVRTGILGVYIVWQNASKSKLYTGLEESKLICLICVYLNLTDCFVSSPSPKNMFVSLLFSPVKRRHILCSGEQVK